MQRFDPICGLTRITLSTVSFCVLLTSQLPAQTSQPRPASVLPATSPTTPAAAAPSSSPAPTPSTTPSRRADVSYVAGQLSVTASNSSLNQILREISRQTGMKITGGVADERVFGTYGPAAPAEILAALLDGTASNMLLVQSAPPADSPTTGLQAAKVPVELVLTPRHGGPTPPNPNATSFNDGGDSAESTPADNSSAFRNPPPPPLPPSDAPADPNTPAAVPSPASNDAPAADDKSSGGAKTPQQIYEQLLRMRQQPTAPPQQ